MLGPATRVGLRAGTAHRAGSGWVGRHERQARGPKIQEGKAAALLPHLGPRATTWSEHALAWPWDREETWVGVFQRQEAQGLRKGATGTWEPA